MANNSKGERSEIKSGEDRGDGDAGIKIESDLSAQYRSTDTPLRDKVYNWIVRRYEKNGRQWNMSDTVVWYGAIYELSNWIIYPIAVGFFWALAELAIKIRGKGDPIYGLMLLLVLLLVRFGRASTMQRQIKQQLEKLNKKL